MKFKICYEIIEKKIYKTISKKEILIVLVELSAKIEPDAYDQCAGTVGEGERVKTNG